MLKVLREFIFAYRNPKRGQQEKRVMPHYDLYVIAA